MSFAIYDSHFKSINPYERDARVTAQTGAVFCAIVTGERKLTALGRAC
jgi:hypothetical protein